MDTDEIKAIAKAVVADRKKRPPPRTCRFPLRFDNFRRVTTTDGLSPGMLRQLVAVGRDGAGGAWSPERVLEEGEDEGVCDIEVWDVLDADDQLAYRVWIYGCDNGTVCIGDTPSVIAGCSQGGVESKDEELATELVEARKRIPDVPKGSTVWAFG